MNFPEQPIRKSFPPTDAARLQETVLPDDNDRRIFLSTSPARSADRRGALAVVVASALLFAAAVPFAGVPLAQIPAFVASYQSALATNDLITAVLLYAQFNILRSRALLLLATGYLFAAAAAVLHALTFPGLFAAPGLLNAGSQTTVWLYMAWHGGFPLFVLGYALLKDGNNDLRPDATIRRLVLTSVVAVLALIAAIGWIVTSGHDLLPVLLRDGRYTSTMLGVVTGVWCLSLLALLTLWIRGPHSVLDVWLMVVLCAWLFDIALSAILNVARFDLGFYAGRIYGLCAASLVLAVILIENVALQAKMFRMLGVVRRQAASERDYHLQRERLFSAVVESANDAIITKSLDGTITGWNPAAERLFGYSAGEAVGKPIGLIVPAERHSETNDILRRIGEGDKIFDFETIRMRRDGKAVEVSLTIWPLLAETGEIIGASKTAHDIGERKRTQMALDQEIEERRRIFETSQDIVVVTDAEGKIVQVNPSVTATLGYDPPEIVGRNAREFIHGDDLEGTRQELRAARAAQHTRNFEARFIHKDGQAVTLNWNGGWSDAVQRYFFIGRDLTEKLASEALLRQAQKMEAVGQLTGGVAHDFNNILTVITGTIEILSDALADRPELAAITRLIDEAAGRGASLTGHLLAFARKQPLQPREVAINALVTETAKLLGPTLGEHIRIDLMLASDAWPAIVDPAQLTTAILNLSLNARDAMPKGGKLALETSNAHLDQRYAEMHNEVVPGHYVMIAVSDTGSGIAAKDIERVFDPFFTTKDVGKGTGLGLSMVYGFVKQSNGHIKIYSEQGHGTTVKLYLPRADGVDFVAGDGSAEAAYDEGGDEVVLVVEDDTLVRKSAVTQIESLGYATFEASNATEALDIIEANAIDLLFTDVIMPGGMNGRQLVAEAVRRRPSLKTLYTSGYTENAIVHHGRLDSGVLLLAKPYRKTDLARMIRKALAD